MLISGRSSDGFGDKVFRSTLAWVAAALAVLLALPAFASANGTIVAKKGGDRDTSQSSITNYASGLAGVEFEYTTDAAKAANPSSTGWTAFGSTTDANGQASVSVPAGTYYVRERTTAAGFNNYGPVQALAFDPRSGTPSTLQPYVAKVEVTEGRTTNARPNRSERPANPWQSGYVPTPQHLDIANWNANYNTSNSNQDNTLSPFINIRNNQEFPSICGLNLLLVLDRSGSISPYKSTYESAAKGLVDSLAGTPTQISIVSFSSSANSYQDGSGTASYTISPRSLANPSGVTDLKNTITSVYAGPSGGTNWDDGLQKASAAAGFSPDALTGQTANPDVVVFITDGNPTYNQTNDGGDGGNVALMNLTAGMASANLVKNRGARPAVGADPATKLKLFALGVSTGTNSNSINADSLKAVSGPLFGEDYETPTVTELTDKLTELAARTCGARVYIRKHLTTDATNQSGWNYSGSATAGTMSWLGNDQATHTTGTVPNTIVQTGILLTKLPSTGASVTVDENTTGQPISNFALTSKVCKTGDGWDDPDGVAVTPTGSTAMGLTVQVPRGGALYCTFTNAPAAKIELKKTLNPSNDPGKFNLSATRNGGGGTVTATDAGNGGTSGAGGTNVQPGTYTLTETAGTGTSAADYTMGAPVCVKRAGGSVTVTSGQIALAADDDVICTWTNTRNKGSIELKKAWVGTPGRTTLQIGTTAGGTQTDTQLTGANGAAPLTTGPNNVNTGTYYVSESGGLADHDSSLACTKNGSAYTPGANDSVVVGKDETVVCTFTNTRKQGTIKLVKHLINGGNDKFNLKIDGVNQTVSPGGGTSFGHNDATAILPKDTGNYTVTEAAVAPALDANYVSSLSCINNGQGTPDIDGTVAIAKNDNWVCTFTNSRKQGTVTLNKQWIGTPGQTTLQVGTTNGGSDVASVLTGVNGGVPQTTGIKTVNTGTYYVSESGGLADYSSTLSCINNQTGPADTDGQLTVALGDNWVCTYTNSRKQASVELKKQWVGTGGQTTLNIGSSSGGTDVASVLTGANGGAPLTTTAKTVNTGTYYVSESGGLSDYDSSLSCSINGGTAFTPPNDAVTVAQNEAAVCTFVNTRRQGSIELKKAWVGTGGQTTLNIGTSAGGSQVIATQTGAAGAAPLTTGPNNVDTGTYYVSESGGLADYDSSLACTKNGNAYTPGANDSVVVGKNDTVVCTFTNTRKTGTIKLVKHLIGGGNDEFNLKIDGVNQTVSPGGGTEFGHNDATAILTKEIGSYAVSEAAVAPADLALYDRSLSCVNNGQGTPDTDGAVAIAKGDNWVCTFTNTKKARVTVKKVTVPSAASDVFGFTGTLAGAFNLNGAGAGSDKTVYVSAGSYTAIENDPTAQGYLLDSIVCDDTASTVSVPNRTATIVATSGGNVTCTFTNRKIDGKINVVKSPATQNVYADGTASYTYVVTNPGTTAVHDVTVADDKCSSVTLDNKGGDGSPSTLDPGDTWTYKCSVHPAGSLFVDNATDVTNTVTVGGKDELNNPVSDTDTAQTHLLKPQIHVVKSPASQNVYADGTASYTYVVTNPGNTPLKDVGVSDDKCSPLSAPDKGTDSTPNTLDPGDSWSYTCSVNPAGSLFSGNATDVTNTVTAKGTDTVKGREVSDTDTAQTHLLKPQIHVDKTPASQTINYVTGTASYTYVVTNPGNTPLENVTISDDKCSPLSAPDKGTDASPDTLDPGDSWTYTCTISATDLFGSSPSPDDVVINKVTVGGTDTIGPTDGEPKTVTGDDTAETKLETGTLILEKDLRPSDDPGRFLLKHDGSSATVADSDGSHEFGDGDESDPIKVIAGVPVTVGEEAASEDHPLSDYVRSVECTERADESGEPVNLLDGDEVTVGSGQTVVCTFTNVKKARVTIKKVVSNPVEGDGPAFGFTTDLPSHEGGEGNEPIEAGEPNTFSLENGEQTSVLVDPEDGPFTVAEDDPSGIEPGYRLTSAVCEGQMEARSVRMQEEGDEPDRSVRIYAGPGAEVTCTFTNKRIVGLQVVVKTPKSQAVYKDGTAHYTYEVTNNGTSDLTDVKVSDDKCPVDPNQVPTKEQPDGGGGFVPDSTPDVLNPDDRWTYTCSISAAELFGSGSGPITNTVTVTAKDELGRDTPPATDTAQTTLLVPGVALDKTVAPGSESPVAGAAVTFNIAVTNTGNTSLVKVDVNDDLCPANLSGPDKGSDATPATLDPGETWKYTCVVQTTAAQAGQTITNNATVTATDTPGGKTVTSTDNAQVSLPVPPAPPAPPVVDEGKPVPPPVIGQSKGTARMRGTAGCVKSAYASAIVTGRNIKSVTFYRNGKKIKTLHRPNKGSQWKLNLRSKSLKYGNYKIRARVVFKPNTSPKRKTLNIQFSKCRPRIKIRPKFTG